MILRRLGNKSKIAHTIQSYFPAHQCYIEPFFGAGGMFFNKPKAKYNFMNDLDSDIYNLYLVIREHKNELQKQFEIMPIHYELFEHWKRNKETDPILKAVRFLFLSNFTFLGMTALQFKNQSNSKTIVLNNIDRTYHYISDVYFHNTDAVSFLKSVTFRRQKEKQNVFIYCDPPYLYTTNNYGNIFTVEKLKELIECLIGMNVKFAISEFQSKTIMNIAKDYELNYFEVKERRTLQNRNTEILLTNYKVEGRLWD